MISDPIRPPQSDGQQHSHGLKPNGQTTDVETDPRTETARIIRSGGAGWVTEGDGVDALAEGITQALNSKEELQLRGERGWNLAQDQYNWQKMSDRVADVLLEKASLPRT